MFSDICTCRSILQCTAAKTHSELSAPHVGGASPLYVYMSGKFSEKCRTYTHQNGSGHIHGGGGGRYRFFLKKGVGCSVQSLLREES